MFAKSEGFEICVFGVDETSFAGRYSQVIALTGVLFGICTTGSSGFCVAVGVGDEVVVGFGFATATPLFQTSFLPLFTHVYFLPAYVAVEPDLEQVEPAFGAANALVGMSSAKANTKAISGFFMELVCGLSSINTTI